MSTQIFPKAWQETATSKTTITAATPVEAHWWDDLSDEAKSEYVAEHPNSKYADMHRESKEKQVAPGKPKVDDVPAAPGHTPEPTPAPAPKAVQTEKEKAKSAAAHESLKSPDLQPKSSFRKKIGAYLKSRPQAIWGHMKHEAKEFKVAGAALAGLARGKPLDDHGKKALASVAADLAIITATLVTGGHAAHGIAAFLAHGGSHLAQDCLIKSAVKGAVHHASINPFLVVSSADDNMESIINRAVAMMAEELESGDLQKYVDAADNEGGAKAATPVTARIDMSAEVAGRGMCPECKKPMTVVVSGTSKMWACAADRISLPVPNGYTA